MAAGSISHAMSYAAVATRTNADLSASQLPLVAASDSIRHTMEVIDASSRGIALVVDDRRRLQGVITDGDIRRAILAGTDLSADLVNLLATKSAAVPVTARAGTSKEELLELMREFSLQQIPLLDDKDCVTGLATIHQLVPNSILPVRAAILTGTGGTRSRAGSLLKPMIPVGNRPLLELIIGHLRNVGIRQVCVCSARGEPTIEQHFGDGSRLGVKLQYLHDRQSEHPGGVNSLGASGLPLLIVSGDILTRVDYGAMLEYHREHRADLTMAVQARDPDSAREVVDTDGVCVQSIRDQDRPGCFVNAGIYLLSQEICGRLSAGSLQCMSELIRQLVSEGLKVVSFPIHEYWMSIGSMLDYQRLLADSRKGIFDDIAAASACCDAGVPPADNVIPLCVPQIEGNEWRYVKECLDSKWVSSVGPFVDSFETMVANYVGADFGIATCNGTAALHIALLTAGVQPDDEVLVPTLTFVAPVNAIRYVGAWPVFIDAEPQYMQLDACKLADFIAKECRWKDGELINKSTGRCVRAVLPVHILGHPCDMDPILEIARKYRLVVIEDASESLGARYKGRMVGGMGDLACFSFNGNKLITTGGGGMIVTRNEGWARRAKYLTTQAKDDSVEYVHREIGYNYRLTNVQAALGCAQMEHLDQFIERKRSIATRYSEALGSLEGITVPGEAPDVESSYWLYTLQIDQRKRGIDSRELLRQLSDAGVQARPLWHPIHSLPPYVKCQSFCIEVADRLYRAALSIPSSVGLTPSDQQAVIDAVQFQREPN